MYGEEADYCLRAPRPRRAAPGARDPPRASGTPPARRARCRGSTTRPATGSSTPPATCRRWRMARAVAASAAFDLLTLAQVRRLDAVARHRARLARRACARCRASAGARRPDERRRRRRAGSSACARPSPSSAGSDACERRRSPARRAAAAAARRRRSAARDRLHGDRRASSTCTSAAACGSGRTRPLVPTERLGELYPQGYNAYALPAQPAARAAATGLFRWRYWRGLRRPPLVELRRRPPGRLLDVGSGRGDLGVTLAGSGWRVTGLEPSPDACDEARARGVPTVQGTLTTADRSTAPLRRDRLPALARARRRAARRPARGARAARSRRAGADLAAELRLLARAPLRRRLVPPRPPAPPLALHRARPRGAARAAPASRRPRPPRRRAPTACR